MKKKAVALSALIGCLVSPEAARATVTPVALFINTIITNYTVPAGKVLLIEQLSAWAAYNAPNPPRIVVETKILNIVNNGVLTSDWGFLVSDQNQAVTLTRPLRIPAGGILGINPATGYNEIHMLGLLIDATDLYAANVGGAVNQASVAGGALSGTVSLTSPRPVRIASATSSDLTVPWSPNLTEQKQRGSDPRVWKVQTAVAGNDKFLSISAKAPEEAPPAFP